MHFTKGMAEYWSALSIMNKFLTEVYVNLELCEPWAFYKMKSTLEEIIKSFLSHGFINHVYFH